ncbi:unnamed protein product [Dovyalis caffra]|uniref:Chitinase domain-containing protein 1 n=1 Tax=Dovyalis caffra TaxID=77055 RepID=A0AAV1SCL7_9ROSI|nr:unnamed protein product [Dovyalis caffra]
MAKKRDRRVAPSSDHHQTRVKTPTRADQFSESSASDRKLMTVFIVFFIVIPAVSVLVYRIKYAPNTDASYPQFQEGGLVKTDVNYQEILDENTKVSKNESHRHYTYPVLAYITPWNSKGYDMAKRFTNKITHLCPVWYDLKSQGTGLVLEGRHNADMGWISELRRNGNALVLPRVVLEAFPKELLKKKKLIDKAIDVIISECKEMEYDGIVLESWSRWAAYGVLHDPEMRNKALRFIKQLGHALHSVSSSRNGKQHLQLVYVIGPPYSEKLQPHDFGPEDLQSLHDAVDGFSFMTYDFSGPHNPGPNAPLKWIRFTLQIILGNSGAQALVNKIFLGINFYGNDFMLSEENHVFHARKKPGEVLYHLQERGFYKDYYLNNTLEWRAKWLGKTGSEGGGAITGREYLTLLEKHKPKLQWEKNSGEHFFLYVDDDHVNHAVFYPSLMSISMRLEEARLQGVGISIWEIGQASVYRALSKWLRRFCKRPRLFVTKNYDMGTLNAASLTPLSVLCERRAEPRKSLSLPTVSPLKISNSTSINASRSTTQQCLSRTLHSGIVLLSSVLSTGLARAITYEEALDQSASFFSSDFDANGILDSVIKFGTENPTIIAGGVTVLAVPLVLSLVLNKSKSWGVESAKKAYVALGDDANAQLLDIRAPVEFKQVGSPDIRGLGKKPVSIAYKGKDKPGFLKKLSLKFKEPENTTLFVLDKFDGNSELVAELVTVNGFKAAYAIKDGAEGPRGWMNSGLPWIPPKKALSLDLVDLSETISGALGSWPDLDGSQGTLGPLVALIPILGLNLRILEGSDALSVTFAIAAVTGLSVLAFSEIEAILQVLGSAALIQFVSKKFLFAEDRKQTLEQVDEFLTTKIAPKEFVDELKDIGKALLPVPVTSKALPAPAEAIPEPPAAAESTVQNAEAAPQINSVPNTGAKAEPVSGSSRPLSPYPSDRISLSHALHRWPEQKLSLLENEAEAKGKPRTRSPANAQKGTSTQTQRKKHRFHPGTVALQEIRKYQKTWKSLIPAASFIRCVRMITQEFSQEVNRWTAEALVAIQERPQPEPDPPKPLLQTPLLSRTRVPKPMKKDFELARRLGGKGQPW